MKEILLTSSVLILALLALRRLFQNSISRRVQYALWGLVLLRLLIPVNLPAAGFSLLTAAEPVVGGLESLYITPDSVTARRLDGGFLYGVENAPPAAVGPATPNDSRAYSFRDAMGNPAEGVATYKHQLPLADLLPPVWYGGMAVMACWLVLSNLLFYRKLRKGRRLYTIEESRYTVYLIEEGLPSPCLFGLFRPAIYLTPAALRSPESLRHVLAHEEAHARHLDPLWSLLRGLCLTVYWFDPLVWWAALASRTDCELACDEGALLRLGKEERIPYGQTLLSLIPVVRGPGNPLLSATTMTAGKRQLKDRITRIAENRRCLGTALFAAAALTALICAVTFTGAKSPDTASGEPLTQEEIDWFNREFFNGDDFNIRNQFLSSVYENPEDIDLYALFYNGTGRPAAVKEAEERTLIDVAYGGVAPDTDLTKIPRGDMDAVLREHMGFSLEDTKQVGIGAFCFLSAYDACYNYHGDTNYRPIVTIISGEREGDLVRLHYIDDFYADGWKCVTLRQTEEGSYQFVSNLPWSAPVVYPAARTVIPLDGLEPYEPQAAELISHPHDYVEMVGSMDREHTENILDPYCLLFYRNGAGTVYAGVQNKLLSSVPPPFLEIDVNFTAGYFRNIFGHDGFTIRYNDMEGRFVTDYYYLTEDGTVMLLARCGGNVRELDLDGDGEKELVSSSASGAQIVLRRNEKLYDLDLRNLVEEAWPQASHISFGQWDMAGRCLGLSAVLPYAVDGSARLEGVEATAFRTLYLDGDRLLLCEDPRQPEDHMMGAVDAPEDVVKTAREMVQGMQEQSLLLDGPSYDDWRICSLDGPFYETVQGRSYELWQLDYEFHTAAPAALAGGARLTEDCWINSGRPGYLVFQAGEDGEREYLYAITESDVAPGSSLFRANMVDTLISIGVLEVDTLDGDTLYDMFRSRPDQMMEELGALPEPRMSETLEKLAERLTSEPSAWNAARNLMAEARLTRGGPIAWERLRRMVEEKQTAAGIAQAALEEIMAGEKVVMTLLAPKGGGRYAVAPDAGNGPNREKYFTYSYDWSYAGINEPASYTSLEVASQDGETRFLFWPDSDMVRLYQGGEELWFQAVNHSGDATVETVFDFMRYWYDEAEWEGLTGDIVIPDQGQSRREIAEEWVETYTRPSLQVTPGSKYQYSYDRAVVRVSPEGEIPEAAFPEWTEGRERFHFSYEEIFVLGNDRPATLSWNWAGNTGEYEGNDAPEGALSRYFTGFMYRAEDGWRCDAVGTGP